MNPRRNIQRKRRAAKKLRRQSNNYRQFMRHFRKFMRLINELRAQPAATPVPFPSGGISVPFR